jgi:zinc transport system substrate-binding protein
MIVMKLWLATCSIVLVAAAVSGCGADGGGPESASPSDKLRIVASFYPLQYAAERVAGDLADVTSLTKPGSEPHDLELTPRDVASLGQADVVVYLSGFQPAVDEAVRDEAGDKAFDAHDFGQLDLTYTPIEEGEAHSEEAGASDPHFWLDPVRLATVVNALGEHLAKIDPDHARQYTDNAAELHRDLESLNDEFKSGLASCTNKNIVTSHNAFGYLAQRYGLRQVGITGLTPEEEPSPGDLAAVTQFVSANQVRTIYYETLVSPDIAETVAKETGAKTEVLDPIEGLNDSSQGRNYLEVMQSNLANLKKGQPCP